ncbi:MAG: AAA family ATPase [Nitrospiraceae bacterium]|nr:AAA family ATPase [Nitrospiraceae bacterium]
MTERIGILGISGVGKSTFVGSLNKIREVRHLQASALIKAEQAYRNQHPTTSDALRIGPVMDNQDLLIAAFKREAVSTLLPIVFDGHSIIDGIDGIIEIPSRVFLALRLDAIFFLSAEPDLIYHRRMLDQSRSRPVREVETLAAHQNLARDVAQRISAEVRCPFFEIKDNEINRVVRFLT